MTSKVTMKASPYNILKNQDLGMTSDERFNYGGYKFQVTLQDKNSNLYNINVISGDTKSSKNDHPEDGYFPKSYDKSGHLITIDDINSEYHDHLFEFISDGSPNSSIAVDGNVDYSKLLGISSDSKLTISEVNIYNDTPLVSGNYTGSGFHTYDTLENYGKAKQ